MRKQYQLFNRHINKDKKTLDKRDNKGAEYYLQKYKIEKAVRDYLHQSGRFPYKEDNLMNLIHSLDMFYAFNKLDTHITTLSMNRIPNKREYDLSSMEAVTSLFDLPQYSGNPLLNIYKANVDLMKTESETAYSNLLHMLSQYELIIPTDVLRDFYTSVVNHCVRQVKYGKLEYNRKTYELYKIMDKKQLLIEGGIIPAVKLKNIIIMGCRVEEYDWATEIINRYRRHIRQDISDSVYHFNLGTVAFYQKDYVTAHDEFIKVGKVNKSYNNNVRIFIIKCLYETEKDPMSYDYMIRNFRSTEMFFRDNTSLPTIDKIGYTFFIKTLVLIYRLRYNVNATQADIEKIRVKLNAQKLNSDKRWLLEKIEELEHKIK